MGFFVVQTKLSRDCARRLRLLRIPCRDKLSRDFVAALRHPFLLAAVAHATHEALALRALAKLSRDFVAALRHPFLLAAGAHATHEALALRALAFSSSKPYASKLATVWTTKKPDACASSFRVAEREGFELYLQCVTETLKSR